MNINDLLNIINNDKFNVPNMNYPYGVMIMLPRSKGKTALIRKMKTRKNMINISIDMIKDGMY